MNQIHHRIIALAAALLSALCCGCSLPGNGEPLTKQGFYFDTVISITLFDRSRADAIDHCFDMARTYEDSLSDTIETSDVSKINASVNRPVRVHRETAKLIERGLYYGELSDGRFSIAIGKLSKLWNLSDTTQKSIPPDPEIRAAADGVDDSRIRIDDANTVTLQGKNTAVDLGGIAKGYIADRMKDYLEEEGIESGLINLGGNVLTIGTKPDGNPYKVGIQKPFSEDGTPICTVNVRGESVVTSGTYQRYIEVDGKRYHHLLDTESGYPIENGLTSVTVISEHSTDGDALSTACFALGMKDGLDLIESLDKTEAIFITEDNECHYSSGMKDYLD